MAQITEVKIKEAEVIPPRVMEGEPIWISNRTAVKCTKILATELFWSFKADTNNATSVIQTHDGNTVKGQWEFYKKVRQSAEDSFSGANPAPDSPLETELAVLLPSVREMRGYYNEPWELIHQSIYHLLEVWLGIDEKDFKSEIKEASFAKIKKAEGVVDKAIKMYIDDAVAPPVKMNMGQLSVDTDFDFERKRVPDANRPKSGRIDVKDTGSEKA